MTRRRIPIQAGFLLLCSGLVSLACSSGHNNRTNSATTTRPAGSPATRLTTAVSGSATAPVRSPGVGTAATTPNAVVTPIGGGTPLGAACATTGTPPPSTLAPLGTPNAAVNAVAQKLMPLLLKTEDLPPAERNFKATGEIPVSNADYVQGKPNADCLRKQLDDLKRTGGVTTSWGLAAAYQPGLRTPFSLTDLLSEFESADGATGGLAFVFSQSQSAATTSAGGQVSISPLDAGSIGDETKALRIDSTITVAVGNGTPTAAKVRQTFFVIAWRCGKVVGFLSLASVDEDPSLSDLKALAQVQNERLKSGGAC